MIHDASGALFTSVKSETGTTTTVYKFTAGLASRQSVATLNLKNATLFAQNSGASARFFVAGDDASGYRVCATNDWFKTFTSLMLIWSTAYKPNSDVCSTVGGGAASCALLQSGSTLQVWSRTSLDGLSWPSTAPHAPVFVGDLPSGTKSKTLRIRQKIANGSPVLEITNGGDALWRSSDMGRSWTAAP